MSDKPKQAKEARASYATPVTDLSQPVILERNGQPRRGIKCPGYGAPTP